ncbi:leukemia NUP98 fusion partner 1 isoform X3 [Harpia harpyja]|uniref:leukemia NUP98 fusion partner 1 isoform X3 n=1 Tax=Harpia harpyja TaxID=202280 RepID=UPI0022B145F6|nr:leukemia NUP98 fusion partner 1 isoform X3 [Harpia harpyja]
MRMRKKVEATRNVRHDPLVKGEPPFRLSTAQGRILGAGDQGAFAKEAPDVGTRPLLGQGREQARLSSLHTARLHASTKGSSSGLLKGSKEFQEDQDVKCHCHRKASRTPSADSSCPETRSNSIQEFAESFEKQLHLKSKRSVSLEEDLDLCVICCDDLGTGSSTELHCMHSFHKECIQKWLLKKPTCPTCRVQVLL